MSSTQLIAALQRLLKPIKDRIFLMINRSVVNGSDDSGTLQTLKLQVLADEIYERVVRFQEFGFASRPPDDSEAIVLSLCGNRENMVVIATEKRSVRFKNLGKGEMAIYTDDGTYFHLKKNGQVELKTATKVTIDAPDTEIKGNLKVTGTTQLMQTLAVTGVATFQANIIAQADVTVTGAVTAATVTGGTVTGTVGVVSAGKAVNAIVSTFNTHTHNENGTGGGVTNAPNQTV